MKVNTFALAGLALTGIVVGGNAALADGGATHVDDCNNAPAADAVGLPSGCAFNFYDGNGAPASVAVGKYKDTMSSAGNETEVFTGTGLPNSTGLVVTYTSTTTPNTASQTCYSFQTGNTTSNWSMVIQPNGSWNLTCNFHKGSTS